MFLPYHFSSSFSVKQDLDRLDRVRQPFCGGYPCIYVSYLRRGSKAIAGLPLNSCVCEKVSLLSLYRFDYAFIICLQWNLGSCLCNAGLIWSNAASHSRKEEVYFRKKKKTVPFFVCLDKRVWGIHLYLWCFVNMPLIHGNSHSISSTKVFLLFSGVEVIQGKIFISSEGHGFRIIKLEKLCKEGCWLSACDEKVNIYCSGILIYLIFHN